MKIYPPFPTCREATPTRRAEKLIYEALEASELDGLALYEVWNGRRTAVGPLANCWRKPRFWGTVASINKGREGSLRRHFSGLGGVGHRGVFPRHKLRVSGLWIPSRLSGRSSCSLRPVGRGHADLLRLRCLAFPFLPRVQLFPGEVQKFLSVELGAGDGGDGAPAAVVVALSCRGQSVHSWIYSPSAVRCPAVVSGVASTGAA